LFPQLGARLLDPRTIDDGRGAPDQAAKVLRPQMEPNREHHVVAFGPQHVRRQARLHPDGEEVQIRRGLEQDVVLGRREPEQVAFGDRDHGLADAEGGVSRGDEVELGLDVKVTGTPAPVDRRILPDEGTWPTRCGQEALMDGSRGAGHVTYR